MTTIAWDSVMMAGDRLLVDGNVRGECQKIHRAGRYLYGQAGNATDGEWCRLWLEAGADLGRWPDGLELEDGTHGLVVAIRTSRLYAIDGKRPILVPMESKFYAAGSGSNFAMAAMGEGKTAREAVEFASRFDIYTGAGVDSISIRKRPKARGKR